VQHRNGMTGIVVEALALFATVQWTDGRREEIDQFDPAVEVVARAEPT
jgi:hypothetical protein